MRELPKNITEELDNDLGHNIITTAKGKAYFDDSGRVKKLYLSK